MHKYFIFFLFFFIFFISNESISDETSQTPTPKVEIYKSECANALLNALSTFTLPEAFNKVGASNIEIKRDQITPLIYEEELNTLGEHTRLYYKSYNISFPVNGQAKNIRLRIGGLSYKDIMLFDDIEVLKKLKDVFGNLPEKYLSLVDIILIKHKPYLLYTEESSDNRRVGGQSWQNEFQEDSIVIYFELPQNHPVYENDPDPEDIILQGLYHIEGTMSHELGHLADIHTHGPISKHRIPEANIKWFDAMAADNTSISKSGDEKPAEDFAETMQLYIMTNGGLYYPNLTRRYAHRFTILDEFMGLTPSQRKEIIEINNLFEVQTNDLLQKFNLPTNDFRFQNVPNDVSELFQKPLEEISLEAILTENLRDSWRHHPDALRVSIVLADKIHALQKERSLDFNSIENRLIRQILGAIATSDIPEFIIITIHLFDTLPDFVMEYSLHILEEANKAFHEKKYTNFEKALEEVMRI